MSEETPLIIAAIDQSEILEPVVARAKYMADCMGANLVVLHVISGKVPSMANASYGDMVLGGMDEQVRTLEEEVRAKLEPRLESVGVKGTALELVEGSPAKAVQELLEQRNPTMLVVGQPKAMLSSVATNMAKHAACDVYIVRVTT